MPNGQTAERLDSLESYMKDLSFQALRTEREIARLSSEMREFKNEMRGFKNEMVEFKNEMREFKNGVLEFKTRAEIDRRESSRKWGELANKMGTLVEDMVAPNLPTVARELFGCDEPESFAVRIKRKLGSRTMELDALLVCRGVALINETKSRLNNRDVDDLAAKLQTFSELFPEYAGRRCVGVIASLYVDESVVRYATSQKILCMGMRDDTMRVLNPEAV